MSILSQSSRTFFSGDSIATTGYIYNSSGGNAATTGWVRCKSDHVVVQVGIPDLNATTLTYRIEGKISDIDRIASVYVEAVTASTDIDKLINISEKFKDIRVGAKVDGVVATPNNFYAYVCNTEIK